MLVEISRCREVELPKYESPGAAGFDIAAAEDTFVSYGEPTLVPTGLIVRTPPGYVLLLVPRSSTPLKFGIQMPHSVGVIDSDYCGAEDEIKVQVSPLGTRGVQLRKGDRIAQGLIVPVVQAQFSELPVVALDSASRGGFGSTGH